MMEDAGIWVEPVYGSVHILSLKLGTCRLECIPELDHPEFDARAGSLGPVYTLDFWLSQLQRLSTEDRPEVMLPFNFSDQCCGWLRVTPLPEGLVRVQAGWSLVGQYQLDSTDLLKLSRTVSGFEPIPDAGIRRPLADVVAEVTAARESLAEFVQRWGGEPNYWAR